MNDTDEILRTAKTILLVDWPSRDVPDTLAKAGYTVVVQGGPLPDSYAAHELIDDRVEVRGLERRPEHADLVYVHRPIEELPGLVALARDLGATTVWLQSGLAPDGTRDPRGCWMPDERSAEARRIVESAGLSYIERPYIADAVRAIRASEHPAEPPATGAAG